MFRARILHIERDTMVRSHHARCIKMDSDVRRYEKERTMIAKNRDRSQCSMFSRLWLLLVLVSVLLLLAACGGSSTASATTSPAITPTPTTVTSSVTPTPTPTMTQPTPTPTVAQPTPTPTMAQPTPTAKATQVTSAPGQGSTRIVMIVNNSDGSFAFSPATLTVSAGTTVIWKNVSSAPHTMTTDDGTTADSGTIAVGATFHFKFATAGSFSYHCNYHPYMKATIIVK